ncbi:uncharacterized protein LOC134253908 [Saccostrea cucullata]|uniref:uncharacterized protein LOC134253908 n=1 Tax=Saccostrea cuccullata TaxID=36930 RepID=UPI002ED5637E
MELKCKLIPTIWIGFVLHSASTTHAEIPDASKGCKEPNETAVFVDSCPTTAQEWREAASRKGCKNRCSSFEYHCVINAWINETIEVCAPIKNIVGNVCAEYNFGGSRIQRNEGAKCKKCPSNYLSNESFKYPECYDLVNKTREKSRPTVLTSSYFTTTKVTTDDKEPITLSRQERLSIDPDSDSDLHTKIIIPICFGIASLLIGVLICILHVHRSRNSCSSILDTISWFCNFQKQQKHTDVNENPDTDIENTPLNKENTDRCSDETEPS